MTDLAPPLETGHAVQFYEDDEVLASAVADFIAGGLASGERVAAVATAEHADANRSALEARGIDVEHFVRLGRLILLDAHDTLGTIMVGPLPDPGRFASTIGAMIEQWRRQDPHSGLRFYGEMVDVLCRVGNTEAAIQLERLWNELATRQPFNMLCGYSMATFYRAGAADQFNEVCRHHARVIPAESFSPLHDVRDTFDVARPQLWSRANRARTESFAALSDELRTPLSAISGYARLLTMGVHGAVTDAQRDVLDRIDKSSRHLLALINDAVNVARLGAGKVHEAPSPGQSPGQRRARGDAPPSGEGGGNSAM